MSTASIDFTSKRLGDISNFVDARVIKNLPSNLQSNSFDLVIATEVIEHLNNTELENTLQDIRRITRIGGYIFLTTPRQENLETEKTACPDCGCIFHRWQHQQSWSLKKLESTMANHGFQTIECKNILWGQWPLRLYFWLTRTPGNGIYYIGEKIS